MTVGISLIKRAARVMLGVAGLASWLVMPFCVLLSASASSLPVAREQGNRTALRKATEAYNKLPLSFEATTNNSTTKFVSRGNGYNFYLSSTEAVFQLSAGTGVKRLSRGAALGLPRNAGSPSAVHKLPEPLRDEVASRAVQPTTINLQPSIVKMKLVGANPRARVVGVNQLPGKSNYIIGSDPAKWRANASNYSKVKIESAYRGIDVIYYGNQRQLEHDFNVAPGADFRVISFSFDGAQKVRLDRAGDLVLDTAAGEIRQSKPVAYQEVNGQRREVQARYVLKSSREIRFDVGDYDRSLPLVIDPILSYSTYLGDSNYEEATCVAVDSAGNTYIAGHTFSGNFPITPGAFQTAINSNAEVFVAKLNPEGSALVYSTYIGGISQEYSNAIAVDALGNAYVTGHSGSTNFPITANAYQNRPNGDGDAFVLKLNVSGNSLLYSTYIGGSGSGEYAAGIAIDSTGNAYIAGRTDSIDFPLTPGALDTKFEFGEAFLTKLNETGSALAYSTFLGGNKSDNATGIAIDAAGNAYVAGVTYSSDFPLSHPLQREMKGLTDAFIAKIDAKGTQLVYSTYLGGSGGDYAIGIAVDGSGNAYVGGHTGSSDFPTTQGALQSSLKNSSDVFVTKLSQSGKKLVYSTLLGGTRYEQMTGIAIDASGYVYLTGSTTSNDFPLVNPLQDHNNSGAVFKSTDGGNSWRAFSKGLNDGGIYNLVVDPKTPSTLYASGYPGVSKSTDGGASWKGSLILPNNAFFTIGDLAIDPVNTLNVYTAVGNGIYKTSDGGNTWKNIKVTAGYLAVDSITIDPKNPSVIYGTAGPAPIPDFGNISASEQMPAELIEQGMFKSIDGGETWTNLYLGPIYVGAVAIDPVNTSTIYTGSRLGILKSTDAGLSWEPKNQGVPKQISSSSFVPVAKLVIDPQNPDRVYGALNASGIIRSTNGGESWIQSETPALSLEALAIDPENTNTIYVAGYTGFLKSSNRGEDLAFTDLADISVLGIAVDPVSPSTVYAVTFHTGELFVAKLNQDGTALAYSTYLGGLSHDSSTGIAVDSSGNAYVAGGSISKDFPVTQASFQTIKGKQYDGLVFKISDPRISTITGVSINGKKLLVTGKGFDRGAVILVNGIQQKTANDESNPTTLLIAKKAGKQIARGQSVTIQVRNIDGTQSAPFPFTR